MHVQIEGFEETQTAPSALKVLVTELNAVLDASSPTTESQADTATEMQVLQCRLHASEKTTASLLWCAFETSSRKGSKDAALPELQRVVQVLQRRLEDMTVYRSSLEGKLAALENELNRASDSNSMVEELSAKVQCPSCAFFLFGSQ